MISLIRTDSNNPDFRFLVTELDAYLAELDGEEHAFYNQLNVIDFLQTVVVAYEGNKPVGCGAMREIQKGAMEIKRMYTHRNYRSKGIATQILTELEQWAKESGYLICRLETGKRQPEAVALYEKSGYCRIPNYGKYAGIANSVCFEKILV